jgi:hypothetical protein
MKCAYCGAEADIYNLHVDPDTKEKKCPRCFAPASRAFREPEAETLPSRATLASPRHEWNVSQMVGYTVGTMVSIMVVVSLWPVLQTWLATFPKDMPFVSVIGSLLPILFGLGILLAFVSAFLKPMRGWD